MTAFADASAVYTTLGQLVNEIVLSRGIGALLRSSESAVQLELAEPTAKITVLLSESNDPIVEFGNTGLKPTVVLRLNADTAHALFSGQTSLFYAIHDGSVVVDGRATALSPAWAAIEFTAPERYAAILQAAGRGDLVSSG